MRIVWLFERTDQLWGGVKVALDDANWLAARGHEVTVLSRSGPPSWMPVRCAFKTVPALTAAVVPAADLVVATFWTTLPCAAEVARAGTAAVHLCQGFEGDGVDDAAARQQIEAAYRLPLVHRISIASHLTARLRDLFGDAADEVVYAIDHATHRPGPPRPPAATVRIGLVGPYDIAWKDIATGIEACRLAAAAGLRLQLVRVTNTAPHAAEQNLPFPVEWHERVAPARMGEIYRSLDVFLGTSRGHEEGFFLPAVEAMANGVPCVLTDIPCFRGHGEHQYALFVPPRDPVAMAEALVVASRTPSVAQALRQGGLAAAARYTQDAHGQALLDVFDRLLPRPAARAATASSTTSTRTVPPPKGDELVDFAARVTNELRQGAERLLQLGDQQRAAAFLAAARCLCPGDSDLAIESAWSHHLAGDSTRALQQLDVLLRDGVDSAELHERRALLLDGLGRPDAAAQALRAAIAAGRRSAALYNSLGVALYRCGDRAGARHSFERALVLDPQHQDALANRRELEVGI